MDHAERVRRFHLYRDAAHRAGFAQPDLRVSLQDARHLFHLKEGTLCTEFSVGAVESLARLALAWRARMWPDFPFSFLALAACHKSLSRRSTRTVFWSPNFTGAGVRLCEWLEHEGAGSLVEEFECVRVREEFAKVFHADDLDKLVGMYRDGRFSSRAFRPAHGLVARVQRGELAPSINKHLVYKIRSEYKDS